MRCRGGFFFGCTVLFQIVVVKLSVCVIVLVTFARLLFVAQFSILRFGFFGECGDRGGTSAGSRHGHDCERKVVLVKLS